MHPLLTLLAFKPQPLLDHAQAYTALFSEEFRLARAQWRRAIILQAVAVSFLGVAIALAGVALMLWAVVPVAQVHTPWLLFATPLGPLVAAIASQMAARKQVQNAVFINLSQQMCADVALLRAVTTP